MKSIRYYRIENDGGTVIVEESLLKEMFPELGDLETEVPGVERRWIRFQSGTRKNDQAIAQKCLVPDEKDGFKYDALLWEQFAAEVMVESWGSYDDQGQAVDEPFDAETFLNLENLEAEFVTARIAAILRPSILNNPNFMRAWKDRLPSSEAEEVFPSPTLTPASTNTSAGSMAGGATIPVSARCPAKPPMSSNTPSRRTRRQNKARKPLPQPNR